MTSSSNGSIEVSGSNADSGGYSAAVRLFLRLNGELIPLAQVGGGRLYFDRPVSLPAGPAEVIVEVDGEARSKAILLPHDSESVRIVEYSAT